MKTKNRITRNIIRSSAVAALFLFAVGGLCSVFTLPSRGPGPKSRTQAKTLSFTDRVAYQRAIEEVYWRHRDWPGVKGNTKQSLEGVISQAQIEKKVEDYLRNSQLLEGYWRNPVTPMQLQAEMNRIAKQSKRPDVLRELFAALNNDPYIIAECLVRPALADRLARSSYAHDQRLHGALKECAEAELAQRSVAQMQETSGTYEEIEWVKRDDESGLGQPSCLPSTQSTGGNPALQQQDAPNVVKLDNTKWSENLQKLAATFGASSRTQPPDALALQNDSEAEIAWDRIETGVGSALQEDDHRYYTTAVLEKVRTG